MNQFLDTQDALPCSTAICIVLFCAPDEIYSWYLDADSSNNDTKSEHVFSYSHLPIVESCKLTSILWKKNYTLQHYTSVTVNLTPLFLIWALWQSCIENKPDPAVVKPFPGLQLDPPGHPCKYSIRYVLPLHSVYQINCYQIKPKRNEFDLILTNTCSTDYFTH